MGDGVGASVEVGIALGLLLPTLFFALEYSIERKRENAARANGRRIWWTLSPQRMARDFQTGEVRPLLEEVDFDPRHGHYMKCGEIVITLASASLIFIPSLHFTSAIPWMSLPIVLLGFTVVYALSFIGLLTYFYEMQLQDPDTFTAIRSCLIFSFGFGGLACFAFAYFCIAISIGTALSNGTLAFPAH